MMMIDHHHLSKPESCVSCKICCRHCGKQTLSRRSAQGTAPHSPHGWQKKTIQSTIEHLLIGLTFDCIFDQPFASSTCFLVSHNESAAS
jgi:hypothetical protein